MDSDYYCGCGASFPSLWRMRYHQSHAHGSFSEPVIELAPQPDYSLTADEMAKLNGIVKRSPEYIEHYVA